MTTMIFPHASSADGKGLMSKAVSLWAALAVLVREELKVRAAIAELKQMNDRALDDIGVARHDIERVVRGR